MRNDFPAGNRMRRVGVLLLLAACGIAAEIQETQDVSALRLVPFPKEVRPEKGLFGLARPLAIEAPRDAADLLGRMIAAELARLGPAEATVRPVDRAGHALRIAPPGAAECPSPPAPDGRGEEAYALDVRPEGIVIHGAGAPGLFYGVQTLCQLIRANLRDGKNLPGLSIRDWPSLRWRCFQDDLTRGPSSTLEELRRQAALGASLKMNLFTYYMEHQFAFAKHPVIGPKDGSLLPDELKALVASAKPLHMDILGNQQSFAHFSHILKHEAYRHLRETGDILCPVKEESYRLLDDLYSEVLPLLPFPFFNVCCDETQGLGGGPSKELAGKIGVGAVYAGHARRVHDLLKDKYDKRMMMWGDIILGHPRDLKSIPTDTLMLTWGYDARPSFEDQIVPFAKSGYEFFVCPGVSCWSRILPDFGVAIANIRNFVRDGARHGALGVLNTSWDDDGENLNAPNWHGFAWGAECSWNASATPIEDFNLRIGAVLFGEKADRFGRAIELLARTHRLPGMNGMHNGRFWQDDLGPLKTSAAAERGGAQRLLDIVRPAIEHLEACRKEATANADLLDAVIFGARRMELIGQRTLDRIEAAALYEASCGTAAAEAAPRLARAESILRRDRDAFEALGQRFAELWARENRPYALDWTLRRYKNAVGRYDAIAGRLAALRKDVEEGKPLPPPAAVGLDLPEAGARRTRPDQFTPEPLRPDAPWAEPSAPRRIGMVIEAGTADRYDLPIEIELRPPRPGDKPPSSARAFRIDADPPREILAQIDPGENPERPRLALFLEGPLPKGGAMPIHVYLDSSRLGPTLPGAASTRDGERGAKWIENDKLRLLLGPEGGHVYRWEVKALGGRDITMPGETGWAGFADVGGAHRGAANTMTCTARGPALVRYACADETGLVKTVSLFGGAAWIEVVLNSPVTYFWAFDDPKNFAADGPTPGTYHFSTGATGPVGRESSGVEAQVKAGKAFWSVKVRPDRLVLGLVTPEAASAHVVAPGGGAGGVGIEGQPPASHFIIAGGVLEKPPAEAMTRLQRTLNFVNPPQINLHGIQAK